MRLSKCCPASFEVAALRLIEEEEEEERIYQQRCTDDLYLSSNVNLTTDLADHVTCLLRQLIWR